MRTSPKLVVLATGAALLAAALPAAPASAASRDRCAARGSTTVESSRSFRMYERGSDNRTLVGCSRRTGRRTVLDSWFSCECSIGDDAPPDTWLRRSYAVVNRLSCSPVDPMQPCTGFLRVTDLRSGRVLHRGDGGTVEGLLVKRNGSTAYVAGGRLTRMDSRGTAVVDEGPGIAARSLAAGGGRLYWMNAGVARSVSFR